MPKREPFKDIEIGGRKWRINRIDAMTGSTLVYRLITRALPPVLEPFLASAGKEFSGFTRMLSGGSPMSKNEFLELQRDCLSVCQLITLAGAVETPTNLIMADGTFAPLGVETDIVTILALTVHSLIFNISPFFEDGALETVLESFGLKKTPASPPSDAQTSTNSALPR
jgi:hypothetical protein